jgi:hypothetical protein
MSALLGDDLARVLDAEPFGLPCVELVARLKRRRGDVLATLRADSRFAHHGRARGSRWRLAEWGALGRDGTGSAASKLPWLELDPSGIPIGRRSQEIAS